MFANSLKLTCKLEIKSKFFFKHTTTKISNKKTQKQLKIAMKWAKNPFKALTPFTNWNPCSKPNLKSRMYVSKYRYIVQNAK